MWGIVSSQFYSTHGDIGGNITGNQFQGLCVSREISAAQSLDMIKYVTRLIDCFKFPLQECFNNHSKMNIETPRVY